MDEKTKPLYQFDVFTLHAGDRLLFKDGEVVPLAPKVFDILLALVQKSGRVLDKDELIREVWADTFVEEGNLARNVSTLRKALGDSEGGRQFIETIPRRGYRFVADVRAITGGALLVRERAKITIEQEETVTADAGVVTTDGHQVSGLQSPQAVISPVLERQAATALRFKLSWLLAGILVALALGITFYAGKSAGRTAPLSFQQLSFRRGFVASARFAPDGQTVIYSAIYDNKPMELFATRPESPESRPLSLPDMAVLSISRADELAVLLKPQFVFALRGTLARMPMTGGAPREILTNVQDADWSPDGKEMAILHWEQAVCRLEYPIGQVLYEARQPEWLAAIRVSPRGDRIAFLDYPTARFDDRGSVVVMDLQGNKKVISREYTSVNGLAWSPAGDELFFTAADKDLNNGLRAVTLAGKEREIHDATGRLVLLDVSKEGKALVSREEGREGILCLAPGEEKERELSWLDFSWLRDFSADGKTILFDEEGAGGGQTARVYLRKTDGSPAVRLGEGIAVALSPDGKWAVAHLRFAKPRQFVLYPTGAGTAKVLVSDATNFLERAEWFPDSKRLLLRAIEPDGKQRSYVCDIDGDLHPILQAGLLGARISPDGKYLLARRSGQKAAIYPIDGGDPGQKAAIYPIDGGDSRQINGLADDDFIYGWAPDGQSLFVSQNSTPEKIYRLDIQTGKRQFVREIITPNIVGLFHQDNLLLTADGKFYAYGYSNFLSELFWVDGLK